MQTVPASYSSPRAARQGEWLRSALAHHHCPDPGVENEIVVLATGIDQYLQEVFHHLAYSNRDDVVSAEDFTVLCTVLGLTRASEEREAPDAEKEGDEGHGVCVGLLSELSFKDFHSRLCGYFRVHALQNGTLRLPVTAETEHVERQIRVRWPRVRRRKCVSFDLRREQTGRRPIHASQEMKCRGDGSSEKGPGQQFESEAAALRELVEDLRCALQGSDARCLALEVALRRERGHGALTDQANESLSNALSHSSSNTSTSSQVASPEGQKGAVGASKPQSRGCGVGGEGMCAKGASDKWDPRDLLLRELKLIRSSRDGQVEEAIRFNQRLEEELSWAYQEARRLGGVESRLRKENAEIRRRAEEAREALRLGLQRVRLIQEQAHKVPTLQSRIAQLESQLQEYRSDCTCRDNPLPRPLYPIEQDTCLRTSEGLQRAVEGKASSDEEEEEKTEEGLCCLTEVKKLINRLHSTAKGCPNPTVHNFLLSHNLLHDNDLVTSPRDGKGRGRKELCPAEERGNELQKRSEEVVGLRLEVQLVETERVRLALLEEKLTDALTLLLKLRKKNVSRRALGKILMDTLDMYSGSGQGPSQVLQVADALCAQLSKEMPGEDGGWGGGEEGGGCSGLSGDDRQAQGSVSSSHSQQNSSANPLLISC
ncbi:EF-hand and coiled-coil domain-containing protein 1 [Osmerus eperlanus]|uniref:EF-hand and coiled-coil domain-containing protein 1 n=1 Tax=Osmerus eperlanus TaxID=29151 RepID=UPI002E0D128E